MREGQTCSIHCWMMTRGLTPTQKLQLLCIPKSLLACECLWQNTMSTMRNQAASSESQSLPKNLRQHLLNALLYTSSGGGRQVWIARAMQAAGPRSPPVFTCPAPTPPETPPDKQDTAAAKSQTKLERPEPKRLAAARLSAPTPICIAGNMSDNITMVNNSLLLVLHRTVDGMHVPLTACAAAASTTCAPSCLSPRLGAAAREAAPRVRFHVCSAITVTAQ